jgi:hypothetical protein
LIIESVGIDLTSISKIIRFQSYISSISQPLHNFDKNLHNSQIKIIGVKVKMTYIHNATPYSFDFGKLVHGHPKLVRKGEVDYLTVSL